MRKGLLDRDKSLRFRKQRCDGGVMKTSLAACVLCLVSTSVDAQWLTYRTPGIPRTADGKPHFTAPAPRTADGKPDLSGLWDKNGAGVLADNIRRGLTPDDIQQWARDLVEERRED